MAEIGRTCAPASTGESGGSFGAVTDVLGRFRDAGVMRIVCLMHCSQVSTWVSHALYMARPPSLRNKQLLRVIPYISIAVPQRFLISFVSLDIVHFLPSNFHDYLLFSAASAPSPFLPAFSRSRPRFIISTSISSLLGIYSGLPKASFSYIICSSRAFLYLHVIRIPTAHIPTVFSTKFIPDQENLPSFASAHNTYKSVL